MQVYQFGVPQPGTHYRVRPSVNVVIQNDAGEILAVEDSGLLFLPGGGIEEGESVMEALHREMQEETGCAIENLEEVGQANQYVDCSDEAGHINKTGIFYRARLSPNPNVVSFPGFRARWVTVDDFLRYSAHENHSLAVRRVTQ